ncbi:MAG: ABC transporter permease [Candidatus Shapirobacteria bacterium]|nr:ABC transporter permease [Candidatus Shapirobacteria bacterium]
MFNIKPSISDLLHSSVRSILKNKSRTILTSLGIIIGVTSVILLTSIGNGLSIYIDQQFESLGTNTIFIAPGKIFNDNGGFNQSGGGGRLITTSFTEKNINDLKRGLKGYTIVPVSILMADIKSNTITKKNMTIAGSTYQYATAMNNIPSSGNGRVFTPEEESKKSNVIVLGSKIASDLFPSGNGLGKKIIIKGKTFKVVGINDKKGSSFGGPDTDSQSYIPIGIAHDLSGNQNIQEMLIKTPTKEDVEPAKKIVTNILLKVYDKDAFTVFDSSQLLSSINSIISTLTVALTGIAAISLIVGGIGIMNIMLVTVTERTREIGLRKAIGAYPRAILLQFLFEAVILSAIGGLIGILLGTLGTLAINNFFPARITIQSITLAFGVSSLVGVIFGVAPARRASKLSPIEALRYE